MMPVISIGINRTPIKSQPWSKDRVPAGIKISAPTRRTPEKNLRIACVNREDMKTPSFQKGDSLIPL
jgi:hypothetical protein